MHAQPPEYQPRLRWWSHLWRIATVLLIAALAWGPYAGPEWKELRTLFWLDLGLGIVSLVAMQFRRRWPFPVALALNLAIAFSGSAAGPSCLATVSLATQRRWVQIVSIGLVGLVSSTVFAAIVPDQTEPAWVTFVTNIVFTVALMAIGMYIGSRRELLWTLRGRATRAEGEQELRVSQARTNERARIAREMHDVLAHRISLVTMHAGALAYRTDLPQAEVAKSAEIIQNNAHEALTELRDVLGVLRTQDAEPASDRPQPTLCDVAGLVSEAQQSGMHIEYLHTLSGDGTVPDAVGRTIYRIVQEALTNARKHAPDAKVTVALEQSDDGIHVAVRNPLRVGRLRGTPGAGLGLVGLAERTDLSGGELWHAVNDRGEFELMAWLPCPP